MIHYVYLMNVLMPFKKGSVKNQPILTEKNSALNQHLLNLWIDYATAFADILHENSSEYVHGCCDRLLLNRMYEKYNRINYIRNKYDELTMSHTLDTAYHSEFFTCLKQFNRVTK